MIEGFHSCPQPTAVPPSMDVGYGKYPWDHGWVERCLLALNWWLMVLLELSTGEVDCSSLEKGHERYVAVYFHVGVINSSRRYMALHGAPYKERCAKDWGRSGQRGTFLSVAPFVVGSAGVKMSSQECIRTFTWLSYMVVMMQQPGFQATKSVCRAGKGWAS